MSSLSLTMIVKNEEKNLSNCLERVEEFVDEIIIVDTGSIDRTKDIAHAFGAKVYDFTWRDDFSAARNFAFSQSSSKWNLVLDADEQVVQWVKKNVEQLLEGPPKIGKIKVVSKFIQNGEERRSQEYISRLFPKGATYKGKIHEQVPSDLSKVDLPVEVFHTGYFETDKSDRNLQLLLSELKEKQKDPYLLYQLGRQYKSMKQIDAANKYFAEALIYINRDEIFAADLVVNYLYTLIDGKQLHKALDILRKESNWLKNSPDFHFVCGIFYLNFVLHNPNQNMGFLPYIEKSYLNCLSLNQNGRNEIVIGTASYLAAYNLAVFYETTGNIAKAKEYYQFAAEYSYKPAFNRLIQLK